MVLEGTIVLLCGVGLYASAFMYRKALRAEREGLDEPSVVETPRARVLGGVPNAVIGILYYVAIAASVPFFGSATVWGAAFLASLAAAGFSLYLAYSLLVVTRMPCVYCWTSHAINWALPVLLLIARAP
ncbi:MAG TPA: vitamin K epoxide reductase family protein, partial [Candidatus Baltobacteraceae bacterium]|nr:vitamin K epoxide reductase family protein [Candidatus Baltobacteraceae bacterium]